MNKRALKKALKQSIPILCSYVFISMAYGMLMAENGYPWYVALLASVIVYTGAFQFVLVSLLSSYTNSYLWLNLSKKLYLATD